MPDTNATIASSWKVHNALVIKLSRLFEFSTHLTLYHIAPEFISASLIHIHIDTVDYIHYRALFGWHSFQIIHFTSMKIMKNIKIIKYATIIDICACKQDYTCTTRALSDKICNHYEVLSSTSSIDFRLTSILSVLSLQYINGVWAMIMHVLISPFAGTNYKKEEDEKKKEKMKSI